MEFVPTLTFGIAVLGAGLGIINTWRSFDRDRVRLLVTPKEAIPFGAAEYQYPNIEFCIEVVNLSFFPLTVSEVGVLLRGASTRSVVVQPIIIDGRSMPLRLEARESASFYMEAPRNHGGHPLSAAYAKTSCGRVFKGNSPALQNFNS